MRSAKCTRDCSESSIPHKNRKKNGMFGAAPSLHCWWYANGSRFGASLLLGWEPGCNKAQWPSARSKAWVMLRRSWQAGLQLEVAKRIVTAARKVAFDHIVLYSCAMRRFQLEAAKRNVTAALREELSCRSYTQASWEAAQSTSSTNKWLLREEETERRGASAKRSLSEEVAQQRKVARPPIHSFIHPSLHLFVHSFSHWFTD